MTAGSLGGKSNKEDMQIDPETPLAKLGDLSKGSDLRIRAESLLPLLGALLGCLVEI